MGNRNGFTLIEVLLTIAVMTIVLSIILPVSFDYLIRNDLDVAQTTFAQNVRRAQQLSMAGEQDSQWGVIATAEKIVMFKGESYITRDATYDEEFEFSSEISITGVSEYNFVKVIGTPLQTGAVTFTNGIYNKTVSVNARGVVNYQ